MRRNPCWFVTAFFLIASAAGAQTAEEVLRKYNDAVDGLQTLTYRMHNIDTFLSGDVWNKKGYCVMKRQKDEPVLGFLFRGKRDDMDEETVFCEKEIYTLNHSTKKYWIEEGRRNLGILGSPGGQMVLREMVTRPQGYDKILLTPTDSSFILRFDFPDDTVYRATQMYLVLHLDKKTYLPFYKFRTVSVGGGRQVNVSYLSQVEINPEGVAQQFSGKGFLSEYAYEAPVAEVNMLHVALLNKTAPDLLLPDASGKTHRLSEQRNKVILLDFWEPWCGPCVKSIDRLKALSLQYPSRKFEIWSVVSEAGTFNAAKKFAAERKINYMMLFGNETSSKDYHLSGVPLYVVIDRKGVIQYVKSGNLDEAMEAIAKIMK